MALFALLASSFLLLPNHVWCISTFAEQAPPGTSSLTFVFDTTGSMNNDLIQVQEGARRILDTVLNQQEKLIYNYVYVPFNDPSWGPVFVTNDSHAFQRHLNSVYVSQGGDCPEMALSGIQLALETSLPSSYIYVFTDARAKDYHLEDQIVNLSQEKQSNVVFVMTGDCNDRTHPGFTVYETIAAITFGQVFHLEKTDIQKVLDYVRHQLTHKKVSIIYEKRDSASNSGLKTIPVDSHISHLEVSLSGHRDDADFLDITVLNPNGVRIEKNEYEGESGTLDLPNIKIIRIKNPMPGNWTALVHSRANHILSVTGNGTIHLSRFGFCAHPMDNIELTHEVPIAHQNTYLMVNMSGLVEPGYINRVALVDYKDGTDIFNQTAIPHPTVPYLYYVGPFVPPLEKIFYVVVSGKDERGYDLQRIALRSVKADKTGGPRAYMASKTSALIYESVNLTCSVTSKTNFELYWYKGDALLAGPFFYPSTYTVSWLLNQVGREDQGRYYCRVTSAFGNDSAETILSVHEPKPEITFIRNESAAVGKPAFLHCRTQTPHATIEWYRGNHRIGRSHNTKIFPNGTLNIFRVRETDGGPYLCRVIVPGQMVERKAFLKILELPGTSVYPSKLHFVPGISFNLSCYARGYPKPEVNWFTKGRLIKQTKNKYYITYKNDLIVQNPTIADAGVYECRARNSAGETTSKAVAEVAIKPTLKVVEERQLVNKGSRVILECLVESGNPKPKITWYRAGREIPSYRHIHIDKGRLIIHNAQETDAGTYSCVAQNIAGAHRKNLNLAIGSLPTIQLGGDIFHVDIEKSITLPCKAVGYPVPQISWRKNNKLITYDNKYSLLHDGGLYIKNAQLEDGDIYTCKAKNVFGEDEETRRLVITGLVEPVLVHVSPEEQLIQGGELRLSCIVKLGNPAPLVRWYKDGRAVRNTDDTTVEASGNVLHLRNGNIQQEGKYTCVASNVAGNATLNIKVDLIKRPYIERNPDTDIIVKTGDSFSIPCRVYGHPSPTVTWKIDGAPIPKFAYGFTVHDGGTLTVHDVNVNHAGKYSCVAKNMAGEDVIDVNVNVLTLPIIEEGRISYNAIQGDSLKLYCKAAATPTPKITWYFNDRVFEDGRVDEDGTLTIPVTREKHRGRFRCVAENEVGRDERVVSVTVHTVPIIDGPTYPIQKTINVNDTVKLPCPARANPPPTKIWYFEDEEILWDFQDIPQASLDVNDTLVLTRVQLENDGRYRCKVSNLAGDNYIDYDIQIQSPPHIINEIPGTVDTVLGHMLEIPCKAEGIPEPTITWEKDDLQVMPDDVVDVIDGTLRIAKTGITHRGDYRCVANNPAGRDTRRTVVLIQEPAVITSKLPSITTVVEGDKVELKCEAKGDPQPEFTWVTKGTLITGKESGLVTRGNILEIESAKAEDAGIYSCRTWNNAGDDETYTQIKVITKPVIPDANITDQESVLANQTISLYCPVYSTPLPQVTWEVDGKPIAEADPNVELSEDKRRLRILKSRVTDTGIYKCIARNRAGKSWKTFNVEVLVPPSIDESKYRLKITALENDRIELGCPVTGVPYPDVSWLVSGKGSPYLLQEGTIRRGITVDPHKKTIIIESAKIDHQGTYTCVASNKVSRFDVDVQLTVLAPPKVGGDEIKVATVHDHVSLNCDVEEDGLKSSISWLVNGSEGLPANAQVVLDGRRLYLNDVELENEGSYQCRVRNTAGESKKNFKLLVLAPPKFREPKYDEQLNVPINTTRPLSCFVTGNPKPEIKWLKDNKPVEIRPGMLSNDGQILTVFHEDAGNNRYTCIANNTVGTVPREFLVQVIAPPVIKDEKVTLNALEGSTATLECPVSSSFDEIEWFREGKPITPDHPGVQMSLDRTRLVLDNLQKDDEVTFSCLAKNFAGKAHQDIDLVVQIKPRVTGRLVEDVEVVEDDSLDLECDFEADPAPEIEWSKKNSDKLPKRVQLLNEKRTASVEKATAEDEGTYQCKIRNVAGTAEKTFNVHVILKPVLQGSDRISVVEANITQTATFVCPIINPVDVKITWTKDGVPIVPGTQHAQVLNGGRFLLVPNVDRDDQAVYSCITENEAGKAEKKTKLMVLIPPTIHGTDEMRKVAENNTVVLPCEADGVPTPSISWNKDGTPVSYIPAVQSLSEGQQLKIGPASVEHAGTYYCVAANKVGKTQIAFDVDVITRPAVIGGAKRVIEVIRNESAVFKCLVTDSKFDGEITWLKDYQPIPINSAKYTLSQGNRKLHVAKSDLRDEGMYTCRVRNYAGENKIDYRLSVLVPPEIIMLDKDKNRTVIENSTVILSCPATGKPEPTIQWYKDGEPLGAGNITEKIRYGRLEGNELKIGRVEIGDSGRFTCEAKNIAAVAEQDVLLYVMTTPKIDRGVSNKYQIKRGDSISISCFASGRPPPKVTWLISGQPLDFSPETYVSASGMKLNFLRLRKEDAGRYTCIAENAAGEDKRDFSITLQEGAKIEGPSITKSVTVNERRTAILNCPATGNPEPIISWFNNGQPLVPDERHVLLNGGRQLQISKTSISDKATYSCTAKNDAGMDELDIHLSVIVPPTIPGLAVETVEVEANHPQDLICDASGTENLKIEWLKDGKLLEFGGNRGHTDYLQASSRNRRLHILSAQVPHAGKFTCVVKNPAGVARKTFDLKVLVPPTIDESASSLPLQTIIPGSTFEIKCIVRAIPEAEIIWLKDDKILRADETLLKTNNNQTVWVTRAESSHEGEYTCKAKNKAGSAKRDFFVKLTDPPVVDHGKQVSEVEVGSSVVLTCKVISGSGNLTVRWMIDGKPVRNGQFKTNIMVDDRRIQIRNTRISDTGSYVCIVENEAGEARKQFSLSVLERPRFQDSGYSIPSIIIGRPLTLDCSVSGTPKPTVNWTKVS